MCKTVTVEDEDCVRQTNEGHKMSWWCLLCLFTKKVQGSGEREAFDASQVTETGGVRLFAGWLGMFAFDISFLHHLFLEHLYPTSKAR